MVPQGDRPPADVELVGVPRRDDRVVMWGFLWRAGGATWSPAGLPVVELFDPVEVVEVEAPSDYVCPQCGPAPEGPSAHAERAHTAEGIAGG